MRALGDYLMATFVQWDLGDEHFRSETFVRTRDALQVVREGMWPTSSSCSAAWWSASSAGLAAGTLMATAPRSPAARGLSVTTAFVLSAPVYWLGFCALILFSSGFGVLLQVPFFSQVSSYTPITEDPLAWLHPCGSRA